jgi:hypothetical protein
VETSKIDLVDEVLGRIPEELTQLNMLDAYMKHSKRYLIQYCLDRLISVLFMARNIFCCASNASRNRNEGSKRK